MSKIGCKLDLFGIWIGSFDCCVSFETVDCIRRFDCLYVCTVHKVYVSICDVAIFITLRHCQQRYKVSGVAVH